MPQILESWQLWHNMLCGWQMSYSHKFGFLGANWNELPKHLQKAFFQYDCYIDIINDPKMQSHSTNLVI